MKNLFLLMSVALLAISCGKDLADVPEGSEEINVGDETIMMVFIQPGTFTMGGTPDQAPCDNFKESPAHNVTLTKAYYISQTEVTQELWKTVMCDNPSLYTAHNKEEKGLPVVNVSWNDCQKFIKELNSMTGKKFRLPTEAEWEYAARGAGKGFSLTYAGSKFPEKVACLSTNSEGHPHPVAHYAANEVGIYDMCGNVWEWVEDNYEQYKAGTFKDPCVELGNSLPRSIRGGSFHDPKSSVRIASRDYQDPNYKQTNLGFRLAMDKE